MAQAPPTAQPDMIMTSAPRPQSVIQGRAGPQAVDGNFYVLCLIWKFNLLS